MTAQTDLYAAAGPVIGHDMLDVDAAAREALKLAQDSGEKHTAYTAARLLPYADGLTADAHAAIVTRIWALLEDAPE